MSNIEEDIKILEKIIEKYLKSCIILRTDTQVYINFTRKEEQAIKHILEELKQDKKKIAELETKQKEMCEEYCYKTTKIKDKTEELKKQYEIELEENSTRAFILKCQIKILEELLEENK